MKRFLCFLLLLLSPVVFASKPVVNVYTWTGYIPENVIHEFEQQTGIDVHLSEYDSNEALYAKLKADPHIGYDVIMPSNYYVDRMRRQHMLRKIDKSKLTNLKNLNPALLNKPYDPGDQYSLPYLWGTTALLVNTRYWDVAKIQKWSDLWQKHFRSRLLMYNDTRDVFAVALLALGYSINDTNPLHIKEAYQRLHALLPNIRLFSTDSAIPDYADEDITIGMAENGDAMIAKQSNPLLRYVYPKDGFVIWIDCMVIPRYAPHYAAALKLINFLMRPDIAKQIGLAIGYSTPNLKALHEMPARFRNSPIYNPSPLVLQRGQLQNDVGSARLLYQHYWELLKLG